MSKAGGVMQASKMRGRPLDYLAMARIDHWTKHVFVVPGIVLAVALRGIHVENILVSVILGFASVALISSANYVLNEWLDREFDAYHPVKSQRAAAAKSLSPLKVYGFYFTLLLLGIIIASALNLLFLLAALTFWASGLFYNVEPIRTKDRVYVDVLTESINNPIRLVLGWAMIDPFTLPPSSLVLAYWMGGAFLMAAKRLSEYREIAQAGSLDVLRRYRRSFRSYTAESLTVSCFLYGILAAFFLAVFMIKYRIEYVVAMPLLAFLFSLYLSLSLRPDSVAQRPERLLSARPLMAVVAVTILLLGVLTVVRLPALQYLSSPYLFLVQ